MNRKQRKKQQMTAARAVATVTTVVPKRTGMSVSTNAVIGMRMKSSTKAAPEQKYNFLKPYVPMAGVLPPGKKLAMDSQIGANQSFGLLENVNSAFGQGYAFPGFTVLAEWAQVTEFRKPAETYAREMTRKWIKFQATGEENKSDKIKKLEAEFKRLNVQSKVREAIEQDGFFGRSQIFIDVGEPNSKLDPDELKTELSETPAKVGLNMLKRLVVVEPIWSYPNQYNANDPLDPTFYKPVSWFVMGREIHSSRLQTIITREVPDILKPAYAFSGLSLLQMMKPYVDNWLRTRQSVSDLIHAFTVWTLATDMSQILNEGGAEDLYRRMEIFNLGRDNHGVNAINKETEEFDNVSAPIAGLDKLQAQAQEQMCAPAGVPLVYMTGITPAGLNASSDGEIRVFKDNCASNQEIYTPVISKILNIAQLSLFGEIDPEIGFMWEPLYTMSEVEISTVRKTEAETDQIHIDSGVLFPEEVRTRIAGEEASPYAALDLDRPLPEPVMENGDPGPNEQGLDPNEQQQQAEAKNADPASAQ